MSILVNEINKADYLYQIVIRVSGRAEQAQRRHLARIRAGPTPGLQSDHADSMALSRR